uniref:Ymf73 n=1 Tax=Tetrahymena pigmentosa TaxID=5907 RepID=Q09EZ4_TETPI|nr:Ymf73 [Tetrahymena pigmentosa]ABI51757.1 Ymf73 [Tetrahymena pigmentosa]
MINKKLNLFLIENKKKINNKKIFLNFKNNINIIKYLDLNNYKEIKSYINLIKCIYLLNKIKKSTFIFNNNLLIIIYKNKFFKKILKYKFNNIELPLILKLFIYSNSSIFLNMSTTFIKFKSEYERYLDVFIDCYHINNSRKKANLLNYKMCILSLYFLI